MPTVEGKLNEWKRQLLDLSKRNRLLHFKETKYQTLRVQLPDPESIFRTIVISEKPLTVTGLDKDETPQFWDEPEGALPASLASIARFQEIPKVRPVQVPKPGEILFAGAPDRVASALYTLNLRAKTEYEERGVGVLFFAFGFLQWFEATHSEIEIVSPILLVPVDLARKTAIAPYKIEPRDDDIVVNPTLRKVLADQFGIQLPTLPDGDTFELDAYLSEVGATISKQTRWQVSNNVYLSVFSFAKLSMYRDLEIGLDPAQNSAIIQALSGNSTRLRESQSTIREIPANELDEQVKPSECLQLLEADSSQQQAIELAKAGASFVLQGPPGTGKSQTIANVIGELLGQGRTVLFVAEKAAALDVVFHRLKAAGLADSCLALHSHKANKRDVVNELARVYRLGKSLPAEARTMDFDSLERKRRSLNAYVREVHALREPLARSVYQIQGVVAKLDRAPHIPFDIGDVSSLTSSKIGLMKEAVARLADNAAALSTLSGNPWRGSILDGQSPTQRDDTMNRLLLARLNHSAAEKSGFAILQSFGINISTLTPAKLERTLRIAEALVSDTDIPITWLVFSDRISELIKLTQEAREHHIATASDSEVVEAVFIDEILRYDLDGLAFRLMTQYDSFFVRFGSAYRRESKALASLTSSGKQLSFSELKRLIPVVISLRSHRAWLDTKDVQLREALGPWYSGRETDWAALQAALELAQQLARNFSDVLPRSQSIDREWLRAETTRAEANLEEAWMVAEGMPGWFKPDAPVATTLLAYVDTPFIEIGVLLQSLIDSFAGLESWTRLNRANEACKDSGIGDLVTLLQSFPVAPEYMGSALEKRIFTLWLEYWINKVPALRDFDADSHTRRIMEFRDLDAELKVAARHKLLSRLVERRPHPEAASLNMESSQPAILMREAKKNVSTSRFVVCSQRYLTSWSISSLAC